MAWPLTARYQTYVANVTTWTAAAANAIQDAVYKVVGGSRSVTKLDADAVGDQATRAANGEIWATNGITTSNGSLTLDKTALTFTTGSATYETMKASTVAASYHIKASTQTLDAALTSVYTLPIPTDTCVHVVTSAVALQATANNGAVYYVSDAVRNAAGVLAGLTGAPASIHAAFKDDAAWGNVAWAISGTDFVLKVTGKAGTTINWTVHVDAYFSRI